MDSLLSLPFAASYSEAFRVAPQHSLQEALERMNGDPPCSIPFIVWLLENPASPIALPGKIDLYRHDCLHLLLNRGFSLEDEAFVVGFTMGNDVQTNGIHLAIFKLCARFLYPKKYRFRRSDLAVFDSGVTCGRSASVRNLNQMDFGSQEDRSIEALREWTGISGLTIPHLLNLIA